jgi:hypothetical protein
MARMCEALPPHGMVLFAFICYWIYACEWLRNKQVCSGNNLYLRAILFESVTVLHSSDTAQFFLNNITNIHYFFCHKHSEKQNTIVWKQVISET